MSLTDARPVPSNGGVEDKAQCDGLLAHDFGQEPTEKVTKAEDDFRTAILRQGETTLAIMKEMAEDRKEAQERLASTGKNGNGRGNRTVWISVGAALMISIAPQVFNAVWWTRGAEKDLQTQLELAKRDTAEAMREASTAKKNVLMLESYQRDTDRALQKALQKGGNLQLPSFPQLEK